LKIWPICLIVFLAINYNSYSQQTPIPLGTWRSHYDYTKAKELAIVGNKVIVAAEIGLFEYNINDKKAKILKESDGFSELSVSKMAYDAATKTLIIAYQSGGIDFVIYDASYEIESTKNLTSIKDSKTILGSKQTNSIFIINKIAYLSTDFGIVQVDLARKQIKEVSQNLGPNGIVSSIKSIALLDQKIFAISDKYLLESTLSQNLQFYQNWNFSQLPVALQNQNPQLLISNQNIYGIFEGNGLFAYKQGSFEKLISIPDASGAYFLKENTIQIANKSSIFSYDFNTQKTTIVEDPLFKNIRKIGLNNENIYIADATNGFLSNTSGKYERQNPESTPGLLTIRNDSIVTDQLDLIYTKLSAGSGIQIASKTGKKVTFQTIPLNANDSRFTSNTVNSIAVDKNNIVYLATNGGIVGINSDQRLLDSPSLTGFIITPYINSVRTLANENVLSIAIDGGNRKWVGTATGLYLFNDELSEIIEKFTDVNSPLPSNNIRFLNLSPDTGELFVYTQKGIVSYRTASSESNENQGNNVLVFPNPVKPDFDGLVGISGLVNNAFVKITDLSGRLVHQTRANGGTASWDLSSQNGQKAEAGIYYIFSGNEFGKENFVTKLAVIK
jgi:hypothetical protein